MWRQVVARHKNNSKIKDVICFSFIKLKITNEYDLCIRGSL